VDSRRYAIDWERSRAASHSLVTRGTLAPVLLRKVVLAVADGRVVAARDGLPDNFPGHGDAFHPAVPITLKQWRAQSTRPGWRPFAYYMHLQAGSVRVK
jgi:hypothetical protein